MFFTMVKIGKTYLLVDTANSDCLTDCLTINEHDNDSVGDTSDATGGPSPEALAAQRAADAAAEAEGADNQAGVAGRRGAFGHTLSGRATAHEKLGKETDQDGKAFSTSSSSSSTSSSTGWTVAGTIPLSLTQAIILASLLP